MVVGEISRQVSRYTRVGKKGDLSSLFQQRKPGTGTIKKTSGRNLMNWLLPLNKTTYLFSFKQSLLWRLVIRTLSFHVA
jgi:hypothetical protein